MKKYALVFMTALLTGLYILTGFTARAAQCAYFEEHKDHDWQQTIVFYPTCESDGYYELKCRECGVTQIVVTATATGHDWLETASVEPTCETDGWYELTCQNCAEVLRVDQPKMGHKWAATNTRHESTCSEMGYVVEECLRCGAQRQTALPLAEHTWGEWIETEAAGEDEQGKHMRTCLVCGETEVEGFYPEGTLYPGCYDPEAVTALQDILIELEYLDGSADGRYGSMTHDAVAAFQTDNGLESDGVAWPRTLAAITHSWEVKNGLAPTNDAICFHYGPELVMPCAEHSSLMLTQKIMLAGALDDRERLRTMKEAAQMWQDDLNALFERWVESRPAQAEVAKSAQAAFYRSLEAREGAMAGDDEILIQLRLDAIQRECMRLCEALGSQDAEGAQ